MNIYILLISISFLVGITFLSIFVLAQRNGQFDDLVTPGMRILMDTEVIDSTQTERGEE